MLNTDHEKKITKNINPEILNLRNPENQYRGPTRT